MFFLIARVISSNREELFVTQPKFQHQYFNTLSSLVPQIGDMKVNLGERLRVKVDGRRVSLPFDAASKVVVTRTSDSVLVETHIGVKVLWDGNSFLEVSAPAKFKSEIFRILSCVFWFFEWNSQIQSPWSMHTLNRVRKCSRPCSFFIYKKIIGT